jgi:hypothetical protein
MLEAPKLTSNARDTFAASVSLLDPLALRDADRDAIADGIERGQRRLTRVDQAQLDGVARELSLEAARVRPMRWMVAHGATDLTAMFSLTEILALGGGSTTDHSPGDVGRLGQRPPARGCAAGRWLAQSGAAIDLRRPSS